MASFKTFYYEDGNAVRKVEALALPTREDLKRERIEAKERERHARILAHRNAKRQNKRNTILFAAGLALCGCFFVTYVHLQNAITTSMNNISSLETQISELKTENAAAKNRISTTANLTHIKDVAINELGMVYANNDQIVYYTVDEEDFMQTSEDID